MEHELHLALQELSEELSDLENFGFQYKQFPSDDGGFKWNFRWPSHINNDAVAVTSRPVAKFLEVFDSVEANVYPGLSPTSILERELTRNRVRPIKWTKGANGLAKGGTRDIELPKPDNDLLLAVGLHEIGHVVLGHTTTPTNLRLSHVTEMEASLYALAKLRQYGRYTGHAERFFGAYVLSHVVDNHKQNGRDLKDMIGPEVQEWLGIDYSRWVGKRIEISRDTYKAKLFSVRFGIFGTYIHSTYSPRESYGRRLRKVLHSILKPGYRGGLGMAKAIRSVSRTPKAALNSR